MKTIKLQVSGDGLEGTPENPYDEYDWSDYDDNRDIMVYQDWAVDREAFSREHPPLPLTTPQTPNSIVEALEEPVWQYEHLLGGWYEVALIDMPVRKNTRQAYKVITPVSNSEPKETVEEAAIRIIQKERGQPFHSEIECFKLGVQYWQAQQQQVAKVEELRAAFDAGQEFNDECFCGVCDYCLLFEGEKAPDFETWYNLKSNNQ